MDWHTRYLQQARWTQQLRTYLFRKARLEVAQRVLELGCGSGAILADFTPETNIHGLDISMPALEQSAIHAPKACLTCGDGASLPFTASVFDIVFCHFVLLWVADPDLVVSEMRRVTRPGGSIMALAEPDYGGRIDYPIGLSEIGRWQTQSLLRQGADPDMGRKLSGIFSKAGLKQIETGVMGGEWKTSLTEAEQWLENQVLEYDLADLVSSQDIQKMITLDRLARNRGERVLYVPTFYAWGVV
jgi:ubiquinone/menaquinone biosynthesis C-methylase UbiE